ncbi:hypothetical protein [Opitutus sp. ER46]|uniref:hypothetical protein n=1 Tax=Opitutus sp. ER46 TaxID=2161864 RepID=UPI000D303281|nr:hypothetical protein [Opitutus sp. ER46]PTX98576.1 hypothetical protein DB354_04745 [Opitutus sp. ER46]
MFSALFLAAATRSLSAPMSIWLKLGIAVVALIIVVSILRKLAQMNKVLLAVVVLLVCTFVGFNWIYERNEPAWATPVVSKLANFFPTKNSMK